MKNRRRALDFGKPRLKIGSHDMPTLPDGAVYLGKGGEFKKKNYHGNEEGIFAGWVLRGIGHTWEKMEFLGGDSVHLHYAALEDSDIVKHNRPFLIGMGYLAPRRL